MHLNQYRHNRARQVKETVPELFRFIEEFANSKPLSPWYEWFEYLRRSPEFSIYFQVFHGASSYRGGQYFTRPTY